MRFVLDGNECMGDSTGNLIASYEEAIKWENIRRETRAALLSILVLRLKVEDVLSKDGHHAVRETVHSFEFVVSALCYDLPGADARSYSSRSGPRSASPRRPKTRTK